MFLSFPTNKNECHLPTIVEEDGFWEDTDFPTDANMLYHDPFFPPAGALAVAQVSWLHLHELNPTGERYVKAFPFLEIQLLSAFL